MTDSYIGTEFKPAARPRDTFVTQSRIAPVNTQDAIGQLASALSTINPGLNKLIEQNIKEKIAEDQAEGQRQAIEEVVDSGGFLNVVDNYRKKNGDVAANNLIGGSMFIQGQYERTKAKLGEQSLKNALDNGYTNTLLPYVDPETGETKEKPINAFAPNDPVVQAWRDGIVKKHTDKLGDVRPSFLNKHFYPKMQEHVFNNANHHIKEHRKYNITRIQTQSTQVVTSFAATYSKYRGIEPYSAAELEQIENGSFEGEVDPNRKSYAESLQLVQGYAEGLRNLGLTGDNARKTFDILSKSIINNAKILAASGNPADQQVARDFPVVMASLIRYGNDGGTLINHPEFKEEYAKFQYNFDDQARKRIEARQKLGNTFANQEFDKDMKNIWYKTEEVNGKTVVTTRSRQEVQQEFMKLQTKYRTIIDKVNERGYADNIELKTDLEKLKRYMSYGYGAQDTSLLYQLLGEIQANHPTLDDKAYEMIDKVREDIAKHETIADRIEDTRTEIYKITNPYFGILGFGQYGKNFRQQDLNKFTIETDKLIRQYYLSRLQVQKDNDGLYFYGHDSVDFDTFKQNIIVSAQVATGNITLAEALEDNPNFVYMYDVTKISPKANFATTNQEGIRSVVRPGKEDRRTRVPQFTGVRSNTIRDQNTANIAAERGLTLNPEASQKEGRAVFDNQTRTNNNTDGVFNDGLSTEIENDNSEINNVVNNGENVEKETNLDVEVEPVDTNKANRVSGAVLKKLIDSNVVTFSAGSYVDDDGFVYIPNEPITVETKVGNKPLIENNKNVFEQDPIDEGGYVKSISPSVFERLQQQKLIKTVEKDGNTLYENVMSGELYQVRGELQNQNIKSDIPDEVKVAPGFDANEIQNRSKIRSDVTTGLGAKDGDLIVMADTKPIVYTVKAGDTLSSIADQYPGIQYTDISKFNGFNKQQENNLSIGQKINIPRANIQRSQGVITPQIKTITDKFDEFQGATEYGSKERKTDLEKRDDYIKTISKGKFSHAYANSSSTEEINEAKKIYADVYTNKTPENEDIKKAIVQMVLTEANLSDERDIIGVTQSVFMRVARARINSLNREAYSTDIIEELLRKGRDKKGILRPMYEGLQNISREELLGDKPVKTNQATYDRIFGILWGVQTSEK